MLRSRGDKVSSPHASPQQYSGHQSLEIAIEVIDLRERAVHIGIAQHLTALGETSLVEVTIHDAPAVPLFPHSSEPTNSARTSSA
jgi:hypothetical protein